MTNLSYHVIGIAVVVSNLVVFAYLLYYLPFYRRMANVVAVTISSASTAIALVEYGSTTTAPDSYNALIAGLVLLFPAAFGGNILFSYLVIMKGFIAAWFRTSKLYGLKLAPNEVREDFEKPFLAEIATRSFYYRYQFSTKSFINHFSNQDEQDEQSDNVSLIFTNGLEKFPASIGNAI